MKARRIAGIVFVILGGVLFWFGIFTIRGGPGFAEATGISYAVGAMMPSLLALIVGCWLLQKPKKR